MTTPVKSEPVCLHIKMLFSHSCLEKVLTKDAQHLTTVNTHRFSTYGFLLFC